MDFDFMEFVKYYLVIDFVDVEFILMREVLV